VFVPADVRRAVGDLLATAPRTPKGRKGAQAAARLLGVADVTIAELLDAGGAVQQTTLDKVRAKLAELAIREPVVGVSTLLWYYRGRFIHSEIVATCKLCGARAIVELPPELLVEQPDDTTHVCHPALGGCNHGFALDEPIAFLPVPS